MSMSGTHGSQPRGQPEVGINQEHKTIKARVTRRKETMTAKERKEKWNGMNWIRQEKRLAIYLRDGLACVYCGDSVERGASLQLDHIVPVERRGTNHEYNLVTCCDRCNLAKGMRGVNEFISATARYLNHGVTAEEIKQHVSACSTRAMPLARAKRLIAQRGSAARVLAAGVE